MQIKDPKLLLLKVFLVTGILTLGGFGVDNIIQNGQIQTGIIEIVLSAILVANYLILSIYKKDRLASHIVVLVLFFSLLFMYTNGGIGGKTGILWYFTFPISTISLLGSVEGLIWILVLVISTLFAQVYLPTPFSFIETRQLIASIAVMTILIWYYWRYFLQVSSELHEKSTKIQEYAIALKEDEEKEIEKNRYLEKIKTAMINLLEDSKELEVVLKTERDRANTIIASMGEGLLVVNKDFKIEIINKVAADLFGIKGSDVIGKHWAEIVNTFHGDSHVPVNERSFSRTITQGKTFVTKIQDNHYYETTTGRRFPVESVTTPLYSGEKIVGAIKVFRDATKDKEEKIRIEKIVEERTKELYDKNQRLLTAQENISKGWLQVQEEKAKLDTSIKSLPLGFFLINVSHEIVNVNQKTLEIFGIDKIRTAEDISQLLSQAHINLNEICNHCKVNNDSYENNNVEYKNKFLKIFSVPVYSQGKLLGTAVLIEDITESKVLERSKDEFFSIASHELRTPLTAIRGNTSMLMSYFLSDLKDENVKEMIQDIHESSIRLISIVNDFLDISRLEQNKLKFNIEKFDIYSIANEAIEELVPNAPSGVLLKVLNPSKSVLEVRADKTKLKEVLFNLVGNSLKYTKQGYINVEFEEKDKFVEVKIIDTGRGIPLSNQNLLFRKFQQAGDDLFTRDTTKGTGLGLYISKLLVEGMGGSIRLVNSNPNAGSTFAFTVLKS